VQPETGTDGRWVRALSGRSPKAVEAALEEAAGQRRLFRHIAREHDIEGRPFYGEIDAPYELHALVRLGRPRHVVEVGVSSGVSSGYLLNALDLNDRGTLHSVDLPRRPPRARPGQGAPQGSWSLPAGRYPGWAVPSRLKARWDLRIGDKARVLPLLAQDLRSIDLFVYDVPHDDSVARREFADLRRHLRRGAVVIVDHGPGGGLCPALNDWAKATGSRPSGKEGTGLYGMRVGAS